MLTLMSVSMFADPITPQRAMQIAQEYMTPGYTMNMKLKAKARKATTANSPYYIVSRGENQGYVIVSGDDCLPEVLGYTESGNFDENNMPPFLTWYLSYYGEIVENAQAYGTNQRHVAKVVANRKDISPMIETHWHQTSPYNDKCPTRKDGGGRCVTGCVATAASQLLYYWRKDLVSTTQGSTSSYVYGSEANATTAFPKGTPIKWDLMLKSYGNEPAEFRDAVATLVAVVGGGAGLTYGSSTSGYNDNCRNIFSNLFGMHGGTDHYKDYGEEYNEYSDDKWEKLVYDELALQRPVLYSGCNEKNEGHSVVVDGYKASSNLFHFNLGWGGQGDGYFTIARGKSPSWGFNNSFQECVTGVYPRTWNMDVSLTFPKRVYSKVDNDITVKITNNSTLDLSGVYMFVSSTSIKPTDLSKASSFDDVTVFEKGKTKSITLSAKPTAVKTAYITLTDANLSIIAQSSVEVVASDASLVFENVDVVASTEYSALQKLAVPNVYNSSKAVINITVSNHGSSAWGGTAKADLYCYDETAGEWTFLKTITNSKAEVAASGNSVVSFTASSLEPGKFYYATCNEEWGLATQKIYVDTNEPRNDRVHFTLKEADLEVVGFADNILTLKGHFDQTTFNSSSFAKKSAYKTATIYDLTQCIGVSTVSQEVNPNALYYVSDDSYAEGTNIVKAGKCSRLSLTPGYDFTPRTDFKAEKAELKIGDEPAKWYLITVPFNATVPEGMIAREDTIYKLGLKTKDLKSLEAGKTYLVMASSPKELMLTGENTPVLASPLINSDPSIVATYVNTTTPEGAMLIYNKDADKEYFGPVEEGSAVEALRGYFYNSTVTKEFRAYANLALDPAYLILARNIVSAYEILDKYADIVTESAYKSYLAEIKEAENVFGNRTIDNSSSVKTYAAKLLTDGETYMKQIDDAGNTEVDFTANIVNPSFETKTTKGWTLGTMAGVTTVGNVYDGTKADKHRAVGLDGTYAFQSLIASADSASVGIEQEVTGLTPGYYRLTSMVGTDEHSSVTVFAGDSTVTVPGHSFGHLYLSKAIINNVLVEAPAGSDTGSLLIGIKAGRWYKADNFTLTYVGSIKGDDVVDAIEDTTTQPTSSSDGIYTIMGTKVNTILSPGLYIIDGQKHMIK